MHEVRVITQTPLAPIVAESLVKLVFGPAPDLQRIAGYAELKEAE